MMGRIDVQTLNVPAEFAAIFEQQPVTPTPAAEPALPVSTAADTKPVATGVCSKCNSKVSAVETKMGRCLTCGNSLLPAGVAANFRVGI
jgi:hypothetical protein